MLQPASGLRTEFKKFRSRRDNAVVCGADDLAELPALRVVPVASGSALDQLDANYEG